MGAKFQRAGTVPKEAPFVPRPSDLVRSDLPRTRHARRPSGRRGAGRRLGMRLGELWAAPAGLRRVGGRWTALSQRVRPVGPKSWLSRVPVGGPRHTSSPLGALLIFSATEWGL